MAVFLPERVTASDVITVQQLDNDVSILIRGETQNAYVTFFTPSYVIDSDISISDIVLPDGATLDRSVVELSGYTGIGKAEWHIKVWTRPDNLEGSTYYELKVRNETFNVISRFENN